MKSAVLLISLCVFPVSALAQTDTLRVDTLETEAHSDTLQAKPGHITNDNVNPAGATEHVVPVIPAFKERRFLLGLGTHNILDTYLSPFEYKGMSLLTMHRMERPTRWGRGRWQVVVQAHANLAYAHSPTEDGKEFYFQTTIGGGFVYNWRPLPRLRIQAGGLAEGSGGVTYNTRGSNNPVQARASIDIAATGAVEYNFMLFKREMRVRGQFDIPLMGAMFSPQFGQSYYEIFSLGHYNKNVRFISPFNAPSVRFLCTLDFPVSLFNGIVTIGYHADVRQSNVNGLKSHAWSNQIVLGLVHHVKKLKHAKRRLE